MRTRLASVFAALLILFAGNPGNTNADTIDKANPDAVNINTVWNLDDPNRDDEDFDLNVSSNPDNDQNPLQQDKDGINTDRGVDGVEYNVDSNDLGQDSEDELNLEDNNPDK